MELLIDIPEEVYRYAKKYNVSSMLALREMGICMNAIASGTPLPEGHGNIIDVNSIKEISLSNITYHMVWQPRNDTELKCRIEAPILVKSDATSYIIVRAESEDKNG